MRGFSFAFLQSFDNEHSNRNNKDMDYPDSLIFAGFLYFGVIFTVIIGTCVHATRWYRAQAEYLRERVESEKPVRKNPVRKPAQNPKPARKPVVFVDVEEDEEEEFEAPKPAGTHVYDPKQHKVVWVPAE